jgi:2-hydroxychromene-2-carboxylate isomerase
MTPAPHPAQRLDFYFSFVSLWTYIGFQALEDLLQRQALQVVYKPIDLHAIFKAGGGLPVTQRPPQRQAYRFVEMQRWRDIRGVPLVLKPKHHPSNPEIGHRMLLAALAQGQDVRRFVRQALRVLWVDDLNVEDPAVMVAVAQRSGLDGEALLAASASPAVAAEEQRLTREAVERQVFGTPFFFYRDEPFWGQDRLDLLEAAITSARPPVAFKAL